MSDTPKSKNQEYVKRYREKQKGLGRRARLIYLTDPEYRVVRDVIYRLRVPVYA